MMRQFLACVGIAALLALPVEASAQAISGVGLPLTQAVTAVMTPGANSIIAPNWANFVKATYCGAGGSGGGGSSTTTGGGGGGGAGNLVWQYMAGVTPGSTLTVNIGAKGAAVAAVTNGNPGTATSITGGLQPFPIALGGNFGGAGLTIGGAGGASGSGPVQSGGGAGGTAAVGSQSTSVTSYSVITAQSGGAGGGAATFAGGAGRSFTGTNVAGGTSGVGQGGGGGAGGTSAFADGGAGGNASSGAASSGSAPAANVCSGGGGGGGGTTGGGGAAGSDGVAYLAFSATP